MRALMTKTLFVLSILLSAQALAFDVGGLSYTVINATDVEVTGRASGNTDTDIVIPATASDSGTTYSVTTIGYTAFNGNALTSVIIPDSVTTIGHSAFARNALVSVTIPDGVTTIEYGTFAYNALTSVIIPESVTTIGYGAFYANALTSVTIPDGVTTIRGAAFAANALTNVTIPGSVTTIGVEGNIPCTGCPTLGSGLTFASNLLASVALKGDFNDFDSSTLEDNPTLTTITYCEGTTGWPQGFSTSSTIIVTEPVDCSTAPDAPLITGIVPGNEQVSISVSVADDGGSPITGYTAYCFGDTLSFGTSPTSPITVSGLTNGEAYECLVTATNDIGTSPLSAVSALVTPVAPPPGC